jgi:hypothetical protein
MSWTRHANLYTPYRPLISNGPLGNAGAVKYQYRVRAWQRAVNYYSWLPAASRGVIPDST